MFFGLGEIPPHVAQISCCELVEFHVYMDIEQFLRDWKKRTGKVKA
jgi:hypothetical protein